MTKKICTLCSKEFEDFGHDNIVICMRCNKPPPSEEEIISLQNAEKLKNFSLIDEIIREPLGGAHRDVEGMADKLKLRLLKNLNNLNEFDNKSLVSMRQKKIEAYGEFTQV